MTATTTTTFPRVGPVRYRTAAIALIVAVCAVIGVYALVAISDGGETSTASGASVAPAVIQAPTPELAYAGGAGAVVTTAPVVDGWMANAGLIFSADGAVIQATALEPAAADSSVDQSTVVDQSGVAAWAQTNGLSGASPTSLQATASETAVTGVIPRTNFASDLDWLVANDIGPATENSVAGADWELPERYRLVPR